MIRQVCWYRSIFSETTTTYADCACVSIASMLLDILLLLTTGIDSCTSHWTSSTVSALRKWNLRTEVTCLLALNEWDKVIGVYYEKDDWCMFSKCCMVILWEIANYHRYLSDFRKRCMQDRWYRRVEDSWDSVSSNLPNCCKYMSVQSVLDVICRHDKCW